MFKLHEMFDPVRSAMMAVLVCAMAASCWSQPSPNATSDATEATQVKDVPHLGVLVTDSPGVGVLVMHVFPFSPADYAGMRGGDFILSVDGSDIETPTDLLSSMESKKVGTKISVVAWRHGNQKTIEIPLARPIGPAGPGRPDGETDTAFLGVRLILDDSEGARIHQVLPDSPAANAQLEPGDLIIGVDEVDIRSADDLIAVIAQKKPTTKIKLKIQRGDVELAKEVTLGSAEPQVPAVPFPMPQPFPTHPRFRNPVPPGWMPEGIPQEPWREDLEQLKRAIERIERQMGSDALKERIDDERESGSESEAADSESEDISQRASSRAVLAQHRGRVETRQHREPNFDHRRGGRLSYRYPSFYGYGVPYYRNFGPQIYGPSVPYRYYYGYGGYPSYGRLPYYSQRGVGLYIGPGGNYFYYQR
jgi:hypothetical protein